MELNRSEQLQKLKENAGASLRDTELTALNVMLKPLDLKVKEVISDGHCLYRSISDQLKEPSGGGILGGDLSNELGEHSSSSSDRPDDMEFIKLRKMAAEYIRQNADDFAPFIGCTSADDPEFDLYCRLVDWLCS